MAASGDGKTAGLDRLAANLGQRTHSGCLVLARLICPASWPSGFALDGMGTCGSCSMASSWTASMSAR